MSTRENIPSATHIHIAEPSEEIQTPGGNYMACSFRTAGDPEGECLGALFFNARREFKEGDGRSLSFGTAGRPWRATWEPKGPKPNWAKEPQDPRAN